MEKIKLNIEVVPTLNMNNIEKKWAPYIENEMGNIRNRYFGKLISICIEELSLYANNNIGVKEFINELDQLMIDYPFVKKGESTFNILSGEKDYLLEDGKLLSYYSKSRRGAIEIFRNYIDCDEVIGFFDPEYIAELRDDNIEDLLEEESNEN